MEHEPTLVIYDNTPESLKHILAADVLGVPSPRLVTMKILY